MEGTLSRSARISARIQGRALALLAALPRVLLRILAGRPVQRDGQRLEAEVQLLLRLMAMQDPPELRELSPDEARRKVTADALSVRGRPERMAAVSTVRIAEGVSGRLFVPPDAENPGGLLTYFHGGGFVVLDAAAYEDSCRLLAAASGVRVLSVDYRRAPEHRFPVAADDAWTAYRFALAHAAELGADPARVAVGGDSAGGNLAAGVAQRAHEQGAVPAFQLLIYPWLDLRTERRSRALFAEGFYLTAGDLDWYRAHYLEHPDDAADPRCSPLLAPSLSGLPPAYIATAGFDPLRDEGEAYAKRLREAGVRVALQRHPGLMHGFFNTIGIGRRAREAVLQAAGALRVGLAPGGRP